MNDTKTIAKELFRISVFATKKLIEDFEELSDKGLCEAVLFNTNIILNSDVVKKNRQYTEISDEYFMILFNMINNHKNIPDSEKMVEFINERLNFYNDEFNKLISTPLYSPMFIYTAFYQTPLEDEPSFSTDLYKIVPFGSVLIDMVNVLNDKLLEVPVYEESNTKKASKVDAVYSRLEKIMMDFESVLSTSSTGGLIESIYEVTKKCKVELLEMENLVGASNELYIQESDKVITVYSTLVSMWIRDNSHLMNAEIKGLVIGNTLLDVCSATYKELSEITMNEGTQEKFMRQYDSVKKLKEATSSNSGCLSIFILVIPLTSLLIALIG